MTNLQKHALHMLRSLKTLGVTLNGCGCCGAPELTIDGVVYEVMGSLNRNGSYHYTFDAGNGNDFTLVSNGVDENVLG